MKKQEPNNSIVLLRGVISELNRSRRNHDFVLTEVQHQQVGAAAIVASALGMGATGMGLVGMAGDANEEADWVEFELDGKHVKGWLWMLPMRNGDIVEVVAEPTGKDHFLAYAVKRDGDDLLAVYPHATAGRKVHYRKSVKAWVYFSSFTYLVFTLFIVVQRGLKTLLDDNMQLYLIIVFASWTLICAAMAFRVSRKLLGFVQIAEVIFETYGWPDVENIDLRQTSKENCRENKLPNFGSLYFRYK